MPRPTLAEDVLPRAEQPGLSPTGRTLLKVTASLLVQLGMSAEEFYAVEDPRLPMTRSELRRMPNRFELIDGRVHPKEWDCPELLPPVEEGE